MLNIEIIIELPKSLIIKLLAIINDDDMEESESIDDRNLKKILDLVLIMRAKDLPPFI